MVAAPGESADVLVVMLSIHNLNVAYDERQVLHDVSLQVEAGQVLALIGPNGSGKSSLIRALSGVIKPRSGEVGVQGKDARTLSDS
jgi:ABC-type branched-subunit amino acid transport system ATPase component